MENFTEDNVERLKDNLIHHSYSQKNRELANDLDEGQHYAGHLRKLQFERERKAVMASRQGELSLNRTTTEERASYCTESTDEPELSINEVLASCTRSKILRDGDKHHREYFDEFFEHFVDHYIPAILLCPPTTCSRIILYFHANAEDIGLTYAMCKEINRKMDVGKYDQCYFLLIEYPGYSLYQGTSSEEAVLDDTEHVWNFVTKVLNFHPKEIFVMGRSIGSGPSIHLCHQVECGGLIVISPFTSIKDAVGHNFGFIGSSLVKQRFDNLSKIKEVKCPCLFIHGKDDSLIPYQQSHNLYRTICLSRPMQKACGGSYLQWNDTSLL